MFKSTKNQDGYVLVSAILILALLTIIGISSLQMSITEQKISTNYLIHEMNFYAAESGIAVGPLWAHHDSNYPESEWSNIDFVGTDGGNHSNGTEYDFNVYPKTGVDPSDGDTKVLRYGDENGDYLNEINYTVGPPLIEVISEGTHTGRGGLAKIKANYIFSPIFIMPDAALRINSNLNGNGVSGSILGEGAAGSSCADVADIMYDVAGGIIEYGGDLGDTPRIEESSGMYPIPLIKPTIFKKASQKIVGSNNIDEGSIITSSEHPGIIYISGDAKTTNLSGYGILFVEGNFEFAGSLDWRGIIIVGGDITFSGGGTKIIYGAVIGGGDAVALNGGVDITYDCELLSDLHDNFSSYRMTSWIQL
jgi:hypothetical protein